MKSLQKYCPEVSQPRFLQERALASPPIPSSQVTVAKISLLRVRSQPPRPPAFLPSFPPAPPTRLPAHHSRLPRPPAFPAPQVPLALAGFPLAAALRKCSRASCEAPRHPPIPVASPHLLQRERFKPTVFSQLTCHFLLKPRIPARSSANSLSILPGRDGASISVRNVYVTLS